MRIGIFIGTRPEIVSLSTLVNSLPRKYFSIFFFDVTEESGWFEKGLQYLTLDYPNPRRIIKWNGYNELLGTIRDYIESYELEISLVSGWSNTALATVETFKSMNLPSIHFGSGLRTYKVNRDEVFRQAVDRLSAFHLTILESHKKNLLLEGFPLNQVEFVGSLSTDAILRKLSDAIKKSNILDELGIEEDRYYVGYFNNIESVETLQKISQFPDMVNEELIVSLPKSLKKKLIHNQIYYKLMEEHDIIFIEILDFLDYITLSYYSKGVITDSHWMLLELSIFKKPVIYLARHKDFYGLEELGIISRVSPKDDYIVDRIAKYMNLKPKSNIIPYLGNGEATERAIEAIKSFSTMKFSYPPESISIKEDGGIKNIPLSEAKAIIR